MVYWFASVFLLISSGFGCVVVFAGGLFGFDARTFRFCVVYFGGAFFWCFGVCDCCAELACLLMCCCFGLRWFVY